MAYFYRHAPPRRRMGRLGQATNPLQFPSPRRLWPTDPIPGQPAPSNGTTLSPGGSGPGTGQQGGRFWQSYSGGNPLMPGGVAPSWLPPVAAVAPATTTPLSTPGSYLGQTQSVSGQIYVWTASGWVPQTSAAAAAAPTTIPPPPDWDGTTDYQTGTDPTGAYLWTGSTWVATGTSSSATSSSATSTIAGIPILYWLLGGGLMLFLTMRK